MKNRVFERLSGFCLAAVMLFSGASPLASADLHPPDTERKVYALEEETELLHQSIELFQDGADAALTLEGLMPENAFVEAVDVTADYEDCGDLFFGDVTEAPLNTTVLAAYEITITDGDTEYQPDEKRPILVEIAVPQMNAESSLTLWHICDDGTQEQVTDFTVSDGKISFYATGFSVYAIVNTAFRYAAEVSELTGNPDGFLLCYGTPEKYLTANVNGNSALTETQNRSAAAVWYFEEDNGSTYLYTLIGGEKNYLYNSSGNLIGLSPTQRHALDISRQYEDTVAENGFYFRKQGEDKWLQHSNSGGGIRFYTDGSNAANTQIKAIYYTDTVQTDDPFGLDGKTYGLMSYNYGAYGNAMQAEMSTGTTLKLLETLTKVNPLSHDEVNFMTNDSDVTMWTFHSVGAGQYQLSAETADGTLYLCIASNGALSLAEQASDATAISVQQEADGRIRLSANGRTIEYNAKNSRFQTTRATTGETIKLYLVALSDLTEDDFVRYSAKKISVCDPGDQDKVIIYTRVWDEDSASYKFYAIDRDGSLIPCVERGDSITWIGNRVNALEWTLNVTVEDGTENKYFNLYNPVSQKYIAPQLANGQILADNPIGLNLPGRDRGKYYSEILSWENSAYAYRGLKPDLETGKLVPCTKSECATFYFATMIPPAEGEDHPLTELDTLDNNTYGITMRMYDFPNRHEQDRVLNDTTESHNHDALADLLSTDLKENGYPVAKDGTSLYELYDEATDVNHLFLDSTYRESGYFEFDSCQTFATLVQPDGSIGENFTVYQELGTSDNLERTTLAHGQFFPYNTIQPGVYSERNPYNLYNVNADRNDINAGALSYTDPRKYERLYTVGKSPNYYNVLEMSASFIQTPDGTDTWGHDIVFEFTGDDDFWLYVDGELVLDLGGVHSALAGTVNFATGEVVVNGTVTSLRDLFRSNYISRGHTEAEADAYVADLFTEVTRNGKTCYVFNDFSPHTMKVFYMERGAGASNLHMRFNLSQTTKGQVTLTKEVSGIREEDFDPDMMVFPYQIFYRFEEDDTFTQVTGADAIVRYADTGDLAESQDGYRPPDCPATYDGVFLLHPNESLLIQFPQHLHDDQEIIYYIRECGINTTAYDEVRVNGDPVTGTPIAADPGGVFKDFRTKDAETIKRPVVTYDNHVNQSELHTLKCTKVLYDADETTELTEEEDPTGFEFRLYLAGEDSEPELAYIRKYYVRNPEGILCMWDEPTEQFIPTGKTEISDLTAEEDESAAFFTSPYGTISNIRAGYQIEVPNLPFGTKFMIEERDNSVPLGYQRLGYRNDGSEAFTGVNEGVIRSDATAPAMFVDNVRGWGLEVNKIWSDADYVSWHDQIYVALYLDEGNDTFTLIPDTVRVIESPATSVRYSFGSLLPGETDLSRYTVREVMLTDPETDENGFVTSYSTIDPVSEGGTITVNARTINPEAEHEYHYEASYSQGTLSGTAGHSRTDTVTNTPKERIKIRLFHWDDKNHPLENGVFTLTCNGEPVGPATLYSDDEGCVAILYNPAAGAEYELTETKAPPGYIGLEFPVTFTTEALTANPNGAGWAEYEDDPSGEYIAYINTFNKMAAFEAVKYDDVTNAPLSGAHFVLYPGVRNNSGVMIRDYYPVPGLADIVTDDSGMLPGIDLGLSRGTYYLAETEPPEDYEGLPEDLIFTISDRGTVTVLNEDYQAYLTETESESGDMITYTLRIPNHKDHIIVPTGIRYPEGIWILTFLSGGSALMFLSRRKRRGARAGNIASRPM